MARVKPASEDEGPKEIRQNVCVICIKRLCTSKFNKEELRSPSAVLASANLIDATKALAIRGRWNTRVEFLFSCIGFAVGLGNVWRFPIKVYYGGGGAFLIPYTVLCVVLGMPVLMMEMGLGQFSGRGPARAFKFVPVLYGLGWCMVMLCAVICIYYGVIMAWSYVYLFGSLRYTMLWTECNNYYNTPTCLSSNTKTAAINRSLIYTSSTSEYWDFYLTGIMKYPARTIYTMNEDPGKPQWHLTLCLLLVWMIAALSLMFGVKVSGKIIYFTATFPYVALILLIIAGSRLPGAYNGIKFYLKPDWRKLYSPTVFLSAVEQIFFSSCLGLGGMITFSSYNNFNDNIYRDAILVIIVDFLTSILAGFAVFPILGYLAHRSGVSIDKIIKSGPGLFFISYPDALATLPGANFWTFIFMLMAITLGMDSQFAMIETVITALSDVCPMLRRTKSTKVVFVWLVCFVFFVLGILLCTPAGQYYFQVLDVRVTTYGLPIVVLLECICIGLIYGYNQFRVDFRMMLGFSLCYYWFFMMTFVAPVIIFIILIASLVKFERMSVHTLLLPVWGEVLAFLVLLLVLSPLVTGAFHTLYRFWYKYPETRGMALMKKVFEVPVYWGPLYFKNWLFDGSYRSRLIAHKGESQFQKYAPDYTNINIIADMAKRRQ